MKLCECCKTNEATTLSAKFCNGCSVSHIIYNQKIQKLRRKIVKLEKILYNEHTRKKAKEKKK